MKLIFTIIILTASISAYAELEQGLEISVKNSASKRSVQKYREMLAKLVLENKTTVLIFDHIYISEKEQTEKACVDLGTLDDDGPYQKVRDEFMSLTKDKNISVKETMGTTEEDFCGYGLHAPNHD